MVARFDADAAAEGLNREAALAAYDGEGAAFLNRRGESVRFDIARLDRLAAQAQALEEADPLWRPAVVAMGADGPLLRGTWSQYVPAAPLDLAGALYAGLGFLVTSLLGLFGLRLGGRSKRRAVQAR